MGHQFTSGVYLEERERVKKGSRLMNDSVFSIGFSGHQQLGSEATVAFASQLENSTNNSRREAER